MKYCVEIKQAGQPAKAYWHTKEFDTRAEAVAFMEKHRAADKAFGQERDWNYRITKLEEETK